MSFNSEDYTNIPFSDDDSFHEECGVVGVYNHADAAAHISLGLHALQHRGQEAAGIVSFDGESFHKHAAFGKVGSIFNKPNVMDSIAGNFAIGHNRYSTSGSKKNTNDIQPILSELALGNIVLAHNGNLTNANTLRKELVSNGSIFSTTMDTEVIIHLLATSQKDNLYDAIVYAMEKIKGGYALVAMSDDTMIGIRDPYGIRPLSLAKLGDGYVFASETCAFDILGAEFIRDVEPGELVIISKDGIKSEKPIKDIKNRLCIFEYVYFSRPDSTIDGRDVYTIRKKMGRELAKSFKENFNHHIDVVIPVPDSGVASALGFSEESGAPFELGIIRNHYVGRTFIEPTDNIRHLGVKLKHNANSSVIRGKSVMLVDDSIVRGTTSKKIVDLVRSAGAKEVHMCISSPPTTNPCFYGVDTPSKDKLIASKMTAEEISEYINSDSLTFLTNIGLYKAVIDEDRDKNNPQFCDSCFTGDYPVELVDNKTA